MYLFHLYLCECMRTCTHLFMPLEIEATFGSPQPLYLFSVKLRASQSQWFCCLVANVTGAAITGCLQGLWPRD